MVTCRTLFMTLLLTTGCSDISNDDPNLSLVISLEKRLQLPPTSAPIKEYDRLYHLGPKYIEGILVLSRTKEGQIRVVSRDRFFVERKDGGCGVIRVVYDQAKMAWTSVRCNLSA